MNTGIFPFICLYFNFFQAHFMVFSIYVFSFFKLTLGCILKNLPGKGGDIRDMGWIHGFGRSPGVGHGHLLQYSCLENSTDRSLAGYSSWGHEESNMTKWLSMIIEAFYSFYSIINNFLFRLLNVASQKHNSFLLWISYPVILLNLFISSNNYFVEIFCWFFLLFHIWDYTVKEWR